MSISVAGLFAGSGGLDLGLKWAGLDLAWANELDPDAAATYAAHIGRHITTGSIYDYLDAVPKTDVLVGGPPCQSFSLVGKRLADDDRGKLVFAYREAVRMTRPKVFLMENVPGLTAARIDGERLTTVLTRDFEALGYRVRQLKLQAVSFGVPQRRVRFFLLGEKTRRPVPIDQAPALAREAFSLSEWTPVSDALDDLPEPVSRSDADPIYRVPATTPYARFMRKEAGKSVALQHMPTMSKLDRLFVKYIPPGGNYGDIPDEHSTKRIMNFKRTGGRTTTYGRLHPDAPAYTINTYFNRPNVGANYHHREERLITVREALRLQSFPDTFLPVFRSQRSLHQQIGNAVPPLMAFGIGLAIKKALER